MPPAPPASRSSYKDSRAATDFESAASEFESRKAHTHFQGRAELSRRLSRSMLVEAKAQRQAEFIPALSLAMRRRVDYAMRGGGGAAILATARLGPR